MPPLCGIFYRACLTQTNACLNAKESVTFKEQRYTKTSVMKRRLFFLLTTVLVFSFSATATRDTTQPRLKEKILTAETLIATGIMSKGKKLRPQQLSALS